MKYLERDQISYSGLPDKIRRRTLFTIANRTDGRLAIGNAHDILNELDSRIKYSQTDYEREARILIRENTVAFLNTLIVRPSQFHRDRFRRDEFFICQYADSPRLNSYVLNSIAQSQNEETGYIPTSQFAFGEPKKGFTFRDETTNYFLILLYQTAKDHPEMVTDKMRKAGKLAMKYIVNQLDPKGFWRNQGRARTYWADELILPEDDDTVLYTQGLAAVALRSAYELGILESPQLAEKVEEAFGSIAKMHSGRIPLSAKTGWIDVSALYPLYLMKALFNRKIVDKEVVEKTIASFVTPPPTVVTLPDIGIPVIRDENGKYLGEEHFVHPDLGGEFMDTPGSYQNAGGWLWADHAAWATAVLFGVDLTFLPNHFRPLLDGKNIIKVAVENNFPEYTLTGRLIGEKQINQARCQHTMIAAIFDQQRRVEEFKRTRDLKR